MLVFYASCVLFMFHLDQLCNDLWLHAKKKNTIISPPPPTTTTIKNEGKHGSGCHSSVCYPDL